MNPDRPPIQGPGLVIEVLSAGLFRVRMPNGYEVYSPLDRSVEGELTDVREGDQVLMEFSPYNMMQARIMGRTQPTG